MCKDYKISPYAADVVSKMILISGSARSGTTILGKLLHSAQEVEYAFEPPTLFSLFPLIEKINKNHWEMLFETFCYEDLLLGHIAGRNLNFNVNDDSCILNVKPKKIIDNRLTESFTKVKLEQEVFKHILGVKMPDIVPFLPKFRQYYPETRIVIIVRRANDVINSIVKKNWFGDISIDSSGLFWPYRNFRNNKIPFWVDDEDKEWWCESGHIDRAAYYYLRTMEPIEKISNNILVDYQSLIESPELTVRNIFKELGLTFTDKTEEIISTVAPTKAERHDLVNKISDDIKRRIESVENKYFAVDTLVAKGMSRVVQKK